MRQWTGPSFVQVMACRLFGAKPLPEPILAYCQLDSWGKKSVKFELYHFHSRKCIWKWRLPKWRPFCPGGGKLITTSYWLLTLAQLLSSCCLCVYKSQRLGTDKTYLLTSSFNFLHNELILVYLVISHESMNAETCLKFRFIMIFLLN